MRDRSKGLRLQMFGLMALVAGVGLLGVSVYIAVPALVLSLALLALGRRTPGP